MPANYEETFRNGFLAVLTDRLKTDFQEEGLAIREEIEKTTSDLIERNQAYIKDAPSHCHLAMTSLFLAAYRVLQNRIPDKSSLLGLLRFAFFEGQNWREGKKYIRSLLTEFTDSFTSLVQMSKDKETQQYGETFSFEHEKDDDTGYFLLVTNCFYHNFFSNHDAPELTPVFCDWDNVWGDELKDGTHGILFDRPTTIGYGDDKCRFQFRRVK